MKFTKECNHCGAIEFKVEDKGPHRKLTCCECKKYIKFVSAMEEIYLTRTGLIKKGQVYETLL